MYDQLNCDKNGLPLFKNDILYNYHSPAFQLFQDNNPIIYQDLAGFIIVKPTSFKPFRLMTADDLLYPNIFTKNMEVLISTFEGIKNLMGFDTRITIPRINEIYTPKETPNIKESDINKLISYIDQTDIIQSWEITNYLYSNHVYQIPLLNTLDQRYHDKSSDSTSTKILRTGWIWDGEVKRKLLAL